jgi:hypothetical protein
MVKVALFPDGVGSVEELGLAGSRPAPHLRQALSVAVAQNSGGGEVRTVDLLPPRFPL